MWKQILRPAREVRLTEADRVLTGKRRPPIACRDINWQLGLDEVRLPSYESLRWFIRLRDCAANIFGWEQRDFVFTGAAAAGPHKRAHGLKDSRSISPEPAIQLSSFPARL